MVISASSKLPSISSSLSFSLFLVLAYASMAGYMMMIRSMAHEVIPSPIQEFIYSSLRSLFFRSSSSTLTLTIDNDNMGKVNQERLAKYLGELKQKKDTNDRYVAARLRGETLTRKPYQRIQPVPKPSATVTLPEYNNIEGMILFSELSRRRIQSISSLIKVGKIEHVMVLRVDKEKGYIDMSKRRVIEEDIQTCEERYSKSKLVHIIFIQECQSTSERVRKLYKC